MPPYQPPNDPVVFTNTNIPGLDRRFPFWNGGGRTITPVANNTEYRSAWCRHGWRAQERQPMYLKNTDRTMFGCRGFLKDHEEADSWDCGYLEEGVVGLGVRSTQVLNQAWDGTFWPFPDATAWYNRSGKILPGVFIRTKPTPPSTPDKASSSSSATGSSNMPSPITPKRC